MAAILNTQPMITELNKWSDVIESQELAITEMKADFLYPNRDKEKPAAMIFYGRNYIVQPPEFLLKEYQESNEKNDPIVIRDRKLQEYITSKYKNDPEKLRYELLKKEIEPYIHFDIKTVADIFGTQEARKKGWFTDFWESLTEAEKMMDAGQLEIRMENYFLDRESKLNRNENTEIV
jgi:hypothetical protein